MRLRRVAVGGLQRDEMMREPVMREDQRQPAVRLAGGDAERPAAVGEFDEASRTPGYSGSTTSVPAARIR